MQSGFLRLLLLYVPQPLETRLVSPKHQLWSCLQPIHRQAREAKVQVENQVAGTKYGTIRAPVMPPTGHAVHFLPHLTDTKWLFRDSD